MTRAAIAGGGIGGLTAAIALSRAGVDVSSGVPMAAIDWDAAITALSTGGLPCSGERRILQLAASLAGGVPVSLRDTVTGLDHDNTARLLTAVRHAAGKRS